MRRDKPLRRPPVATALAAHSVLVERSVPTVDAAVYADVCPQTSYGLYSYGPWLYSYGPWLYSYGP